MVLECGETLMMMKALLPAAAVEVVLISAYWKQSCKTISERRVLEDSESFCFLVLAALNVPTDQCDQSEEMILLLSKVGGVEREERESESIASVTVLLSMPNHEVE